MNQSELIGKLEIARKDFEKESIVCFTSDMDWASEFAIESTLSFFKENEIPVTTFITNPSETIKKYQSKGLIKCGIHPNFMPDSSQGENYDAVLDYCFSMLPDAKCFRAHRYYDVNDTMDKLTARGILYESNVCTLLDVIPPFLHRSKTINFPIFWEDGAFLFYVRNFDFEFMANQLIKPGLKVLNFHPMHFMINTPYFSYTREIKDRLSREQWNNMGPDEIKELAYKGPGIAIYLKRIVDFVRNNDIKAVFMDDLYEHIVHCDYSVKSSYKRH